MGKAVMLLPYSYMSKLAMQLREEEETMGGINGYYRMTNDSESARKGISRLCIQTTPEEATPDCTTPKEDIQTAPHQKKPTPDCTTPEEATLDCITPEEAALD